MICGSVSGMLTGRRPEISPQRSRWILGGGGGEI